MDWIEGEPPPPRHWIAPCVEQLKTRPGDWALVQKYYIDSSGQYAARRLRALGCEIRLVYVGGEYELYARWPQ
jgi:hypothetical protein